ncbi:heme peroxidase family protein [Cellulosimicrobium funkei]|uniref:peroxidase family protein n=1 Tax=Cellulosimicrobium funkei TaxID=264251 RepID=UPI0030FAE321
MEAQQHAATPVAETVVDDVAPDAVDQASTPVGRTVRSVGHGSAVVPDEVATDADVDPAESDAPLLPAAEAAVARDLEHHRYDSTTAFDYLFPQLAERFPRFHLPVGNGATTATVAALKTLGAAMVARPVTPPGQPPRSLDSHVPAVYTYWGQFIDHDITLNTNGPDTTTGRDGDQALGDVDAVPFQVFAPRVVVRSLHNGRHPALNLDSLYGSGPRFEGERGYRTTRSEASYVPGSAKLRLGRISTEPLVIPGGPSFSLVAPGDDAQRDLPRDDGGAPLIPDGRNDENLVVAQLHLAMIRFHNAVVDWVDDVEPWTRHTGGERGVFERASQLVRWHYQWLVVNDYLRTLTKPGVLDATLLRDTSFFRPRYPISMPLEFAVAAFRFGHSMIRDSYDFNVNFTGPPPANASLTQLFQFTGNGGSLRPGPQGTPVLPSNWPIEWARFVDKGDPRTFRAAEKIDTFLAPSLGTMVKEGNLPPEPPAHTPAQLVASALQKQLAQRNLLRGYMLALPTGEAVAAAFGVTPLTPAQLEDRAGDDVKQALAALRDGDHGGTPLWYYVLKEAELQGDGSFLGEVGSRVLAETFVYLLRQDDTSYVRTSNHWTPAQGVHFEDGSLVLTLPDLLRFAGVLPDAAGRFRGDGTAGHDGAP